MKIELTANLYNDYWKALTKSIMVSELKENTRKFAAVAPDAWERICVMDKEEFSEFRHWFNMSRAGIELGADLNQKFNSIAAPEVLFQVHKIAYANKIHWGTAYAAALDQGFIEEREGKLYWVKPAVVVDSKGKAIPKRAVAASTEKPEPAVSPKVKSKPKAKPKKKPPIAKDEIEGDVIPSHEEEPSFHGPAEPSENAPVSGGVDMTDVDVFPPGADQ